MAAPQNPSYVQVQPNSTGEPVEVVLVTQASGLQVARQVMVLGDPNLGASVASVTPAGLAAFVTTQPLEVDLQIAILVQLRINNALMVSAFNLSNDLVKMEQQFLAAGRNQLTGQAP